MTVTENTRLNAAQKIPTTERDLFIEGFLHRWEGNTRQSYRADVNTFIRWLDENDLEIFEAKRVHIEMYARYLRDDRGNSTSSVWRRVGTLRQLYDIAIDDDMTIKNPVKYAKIPRKRIDLTKKVSLTREQFQRLMHQAYQSSPSEYAMCAVMGYLGLRVSEMCELDVADVLGTSKGHRVITFVGKNNVVAVIPQPPVVLRALDAVIAERKDGALFVRRDGSRMTRGSARKVVARLSRHAAIEMNCTPHTLRHTMIVNAIDAGVPLRQVQLAARHTDISTTIKLYDRGRADLDSHAAHSLAAYMGSVA